jgi:DNA-binding MarR family transcriptional regulator
MRTLAERMTRPKNLTRAQLTIVAQLQRQSGLSQKELSTLLEVSPITVARFVDRLEELHLVKRCVDPADRRIWRLRLTKTAEPLMDEIERFRAKLYAKMTVGIEPALLRAVQEGLQQMKTNLRSLLAAGLQEVR